MAESPELYGAFLLGVRVAWDVCGCDARVDRIIQVHARLKAVADGDITLQEAAAEDDEELARFAAWLEEQDLESLPTGPAVGSNGDDAEEPPGPTVEWDRELAKRVLESL